MTVKVKGESTEVSEGTFEGKGCVAIFIVVMISWIYTYIDM